MIVTGKHFRVNEEIEVSNDGCPKTVEAGKKLVMLGHGWVNPRPGVYLHPLQVQNDKDEIEIEEVDMPHTELTELVEAGKVTPLP